MKSVFVYLVSNLMNSLQGYKTYITAIGTICFAIYQITQGNYDQAWTLLLGAGFAVSFRSAIQKLIDALLHLHKEKVQ